MGVTEKEIQAIADGVIAAIKPRIEGLEARVRDLEARRELKYRGLWRDEKVYEVGDVVMYRGSTWICRDAHASVKPDGHIHSGHCWRQAPTERDHVLAREPVS